MGIQKPSCLLRKAAFLSIAISLHLFPLCMGNIAQGQVMRFEITVEDYFAVYDVRHIVSEPLFHKQGWVGLGSEDDENRYRFTIGASENTWLKVSIAAPGFLVLDNHNQLPFKTEISYQHILPANKASRSVSFKGPGALMPTTNRTLLVQSLKEVTLPLETQIQLKPSVYIGDVSGGVYRGEIVARIEYL